GAASMARSDFASPHSRPRRGDPNEMPPYIRRGKPTAWAEHLHDDPFSILVQFQQTFRGVANYYRMAYNLHRLDWLRYTMERSLVRTLGKKLRLSNPQVYRRF